MEFYAKEFRYTVIHALQWNLLLKNSVGPDLKSHFMPKNDVGCDPTAHLLTKSDVGSDLTRHCTQKTCCNRIKINAMH